ncbi:MerR family transcriptional regulator, partial [Candidatus Gracilibacteria bacterium]|nr:MerR family transcriptional regulator [Candidatus Gracilibacteria bacterium]
MYTIDRQKGAKILEVSTRTLDRYIRKGKIRSQKRSKKIYLNDQDVEILKNGGIQEDYEIINNQNNISSSSFIQKSTGSNFKELYESSQRIIERKDQIIQDLSYRLGNAEAELKNSIPILEYKKATFLLESSKTKVEEEKQDLNCNIDNLKNNLKKQEVANIILIILS